MNKKLALAAAGIIAAAGVLYVARNSEQPPAKDTAGALVMRKGPQLNTVCIKPVNNLSKQTIDMDGVDEAFIDQLAAVGLKARKLNGDGAPCDATLYSEIVELNGRGKKEAHLDFRLELANETTPRMSASAKGKSGQEKTTRVNVPVMSFVSNKPQKSTSEREALVAAFSESARQIDLAYKSGFPAKKAE